MPVGSAITKIFLLSFSDVGGYVGHWDDDVGSEGVTHETVSVLLLHCFLSSFVCLLSEGAVGDSLEGQMLSTTGNPSEVEDELTVWIFWVEGIRVHDCVGICAWDYEGSKDVVSLLFSSISFD